jgi:molybdopterin-guanine dinucleotide biosynthesis protein A
VLPVDCPLMTPGAVRALGEAVAVPQTGPLPGAYAKSMLPELDARLTRGELSLRGVNSTVLQLDPRLLVDVDTLSELEELGGTRA